MGSSSTKGWRVFAAHLTDWGIWSYAVAIGMGYCGYIDSVAKVLTFVIGWFVSIVVSTLLFCLMGITPSEWLWGCKLKMKEPDKGRFVSYLMRRLAMNKLEFANHNNSWFKSLVGAVILLVIIGIYFA